MRSGSLSLPTLVPLVLVTLSMTSYVLSYTENRSWIRTSHSPNSKTLLCTESADCLAPPPLKPSEPTGTSLPAPVTNVEHVQFVELKSLRRRKRHERSRPGKCLQEREERGSAASDSSSTEYIPTCRKDGSYAAIQCHPSTRSCWCVNRGGRPFPGSSVLRGRPNCTKYLRQGKSATKRRSSHGKNNRKSCNYADRSRFNVALIRTFSSEYNRYRSITSSYFDSDETSDDIVLSWKFDNLDRNRDTVLHKNETMVLKHLVKQQIQPRACAKNFISFCAKGDQRITRKEWLDCLRLPSLDNRSSPGSMHPSQLLKPGGSGSNFGSDFHHLLKQGGSGGEQPEVSNCWTDRQSALASQIRNESVIIPECSVGGLYHKVQCAQGRTYCWCVEEESGLQIPNTVVVNSVPDCNSRYSKPMKGCAGQKKQKFLSDLLDLLMKKMTSALEHSTRLPVEYRSLSVQEQSARWYFGQLDTNLNGVLDRNEWKEFRNETGRDKRLRKCGKKLPRHCDSNQDRRITSQEWVECLGVQLFSPRPTPNPNPNSKRPVNRSNGRRNGKNPFTNILKQR